MASIPSSVIGVDIGLHSMKAIQVNRLSGGRMSVTNFATQLINRDTSEASLASQLGQLVKRLGGSSKAFALTTSCREAIIKIIEQPFTPVEVLRDALKINATALLKQDCSGHMMDCDLVTRVQGVKKDRDLATGGKMSYLVVGMPKNRLNELSEAFKENKFNLLQMDLTPVSLYNAFEFINQETFTQKPTLLLDIGHLQSNVIGINKGELVMVRSVDYGGKKLVNDLTMNGAIDKESAILLLEQGDAGMGQTARDSLHLLSREVINSIGFFEGQWDQTIGKIFVSGGPSKAEMMLQNLSDAADLPCQVWDPLDSCENGMKAQKAEEFVLEGRNFNAAFGAAVEALTNKR